MTQILMVLTSIALLDSVSITPLACVPLLALLGAERGLRNSIAFLSGIFVPYFAFGVVAMLGLAAVFGVLNRWLDELLRNPDTLDLLLQLALGLVMLFFGWKLGERREGQEDRDTGTDLGAVGSFSMGFFLTVVGMPGALPYFAAMDQLLRADLDVVSTLLALLYYNVVFSVPLVSIVIVRLLLGERSDAFFQRLAEFLAHWSHRLIVGVLVLLGFALVVDASFWLAGRPLFTYEDVFGAS